MALALWPESLSRTFGRSEGNRTSQSLVLHKWSRLSSGLNEEKTLFGSGILYSVH